VVAVSLSVDRRGNRMGDVSVLTLKESFILPPRNMVMRPLWHLFGKASARIYSVIPTVNTRRMKCWRHGKSLYQKSLLLNLAPKIGGNAWRNIYSERRWSCFGRKPCGFKRSPLRGVPIQPPDRRAPQTRDQNPAGGPACGHSCVAPGTTQANE
jgi:hypothetical protein